MGSATSSLREEWPKQRRSACKGRLRLSPQSTGIQELHRRSSEALTTLLSTTALLLGTADLAACLRRPAAARLPQWVLEEKCLLPLLAHIGTAGKK